MYVLVVLLVSIDNMFNIVRFAAAWIVCKTIEDHQRLTPFEF